MSRLPGTAGAICAGVLFSVALPRAHDPITTRVTWQGEISRIVVARCVSCHSRGGKAPMPLTTYAEARPWARAIREEVLTRRMPKWHAARGYGDFRNDPSLSPFEIALIVAWADGGAPLGTPADRRSPRNDELRPAGDDRAVRGNEVRLACSDQLLPEGRLLAVQPLLPAGESLGLAARMPDGRIETLVWVRGFDPEFAVTYLLRNPLELPAGSRLMSAYSARDAADGCSVRLTVEAPGPRTGR